MQNRKVKSVLYGQSVFLGLLTHSYLTRCDEIRPRCTVSPLNSLDIIGGEMDVHLHDYIAVCPTRALL